MTDLRSTDEVRKRAPWRNGAMLALGVLTCVLWARVTAVSLMLATLDYGTEGETPWALLVVWLLVVFAPAAVLGLGRRGAWGWWAEGFPLAPGQRARESSSWRRRSRWCSSARSLSASPTKPAPHVETTLSAIDAGSASNQVYYLGRSSTGGIWRMPASHPAGSESMVEVGQIS